jgi:hypothetical protein
MWLVVLIGWLDRQERKALAYLNGRSRPTVPAFLQPSRIR